MDHIKLPDIAEYQPTMLGVVTFNLDMAEAAYERSIYVSVNADPATYVSIDGTVSCNVLAASFYTAIEGQARRTLELILGKPNVWGRPLSEVRAYVESNPALFN